MIISDLEHLEVVRQENQISGGVQLVSGSSQSESGLATSGQVFVSGSSSSSASEQPNVISTYPYGFVIIGNRDQVQSSASTSGFTYSF